MAYVVLWDMVMMLVPNKEKKILDLSDQCIEGVINQDLGTIPIQIPITKGGGITSIYPSGKITLHCSNQ